jgi:hypothetical protein
MTAAPSPTRRPGAETSLRTAAEQNWTVVSIKNDWATVFAG